MKTNKASKGEAVKLIHRAMCDGWDRKIDAMRVGASSPWAVQVSLTKCLYFHNGYINLSSHIIVSFRKTSKRGWQVSIATPNGSKTFRGLWGAGYALKEMDEATKRQQERDSARSVAA